MFWFVSKKKYKDLQERFDNAELQHHHKVTALNATIDKLKKDLKEARKNDARDNKGRFTKVRD
jgi:hypothetical protein